MNDLQREERGGEKMKIERGIGGRGDKGGRNETWEKRSN